MATDQPPANLPKVDQTDRNKFNASTPAKGNATHVSKLINMLPSDRGTVMNQRYDVLGFGCSLLAVALLVWTGVAGPAFTMEWKLTASDIAAWVQAIASVGALIGIYFAVTIPIKAQQAAQEAERALRATGLGLLIIGELVVLRGQIEMATRTGNIFDAPIRVPETLLKHANELYLLREIGKRLLQVMGILNGAASQIEMAQSNLKMSVHVSREKQVAAAQIWENSVNTMKLALLSLDEAIASLNQPDG